MNKINTLIHSEKWLYISATICSVMLSCWVNLHTAIVNPDAICYLLSAETVGTAGIKAAQHLCGQAIWPFYSVLIYSVAKFTHLKFMTAAYVINGFFSALSVVFFILIVKALGASRRVLWLAAVVILAAHQFNDVRQYIVRDHGFWAAYLASIWLALRFVRVPTFWRAIFWNASLIIATLFRIEGIFFLTLLPFVLCATLKNIKFSKRLAFFFALNWLSLAGFILLLVWFAEHPPVTVTDLGRLGEIKQQWLEGVQLISARYQHVLEILRLNVLNHDSAKDAGLILVLTMLGWFLLSIVNNLSWIYAALLAFFFIKKDTRFNRSSNIVLYTYLGINLIITFIFLLERFFLSKRYLIALTLVLMVFVPFVLDSLMIAWQQKRARVLTFCISIVFAVTAITGVTTIANKGDILQAGNWIAFHIPASAKLYINDYQLMYYSKHYGMAIFEAERKKAEITSIAKGDWKQYDYIAIRSSQHEKDSTLLQLSSILQSKQIQQFHNRNGNTVTIYKIN